jgi:uncharacterized protein YjbJ (UPF0337 family)
VDPVVSGFADRSAGIPVRKDRNPGGRDIMSTSDTPADPDQLRSEIAATRADLSDTVEALAAKADLKGRAKEAVSDAADQARQKVATAGDRAAQAAGAVTETAVAAKDRLQEQLPPQVRRPLPWATLGAVAAAVVVVIVLVRRRRA